jgi:hypothetical protein
VFGFRPSFKLLSLWFSMMYFSFHPSTWVLDEEEQPTGAAEKQPLPCVPPINPQSTATTTALYPMITRLALRCRGAVLTKRPDTSLLPFSCLPLLFVPLPISSFPATPFMCILNTRSLPCVRVSSFFQASVVVVFHDVLLFSSLDAGFGRGGTTHTSC